MDAETLDGRRQESRTALRRVMSFDEPDLRHQGMCRVEARVDFLRAREVAHEQERGEQQDQRDGDLRGHEHRPQTPAAACAVAGFALDCRKQGGTGQLHRGEKSAQHRHRDEYHQRQHQQTEVDAGVQFDRQGQRQPDAGQQRARRH